MPLEELAAAYLLVFAINVVPALMPPTWTILAFFLIRYDLPLMPLALGGALAASAGRLTLALLSRRLGRRLLSAERKSNLDHLAVWLRARARWAPPLAVLIYSFGPIPSNTLFITAGLAHLELAPIAVSFLVGRVISYTFWVTAAQRVADQLEAVFLRHLSNGWALAFEVLSLGLLAGLVRVDWPRVLRHSPGSPDRGSRSGSCPG